MPFSLGDKSMSKLMTVDERLRVIVLAAAYRLPWPLVVVYGFRNKIEQDLAFSTGKSKLKWPDSKHNHQPFSLAVDIAPAFADSGKIDWVDLTKYDLIHETMMNEAQKRDTVIRWGMDWDMDGIVREKGTWEIDGPHFELVIPGDKIKGKVIV